MKGLFYSTVKSNRGYFITAFVAFLCSTVAGSVILAIVRQSGNDKYGLAFLSPFILPLLPSFILCEFFGRDLERNIKSGFLNYTLSSIPRESFVLSQLLTNIIFSALGLVIGLGMLGIFRAVGGEEWVGSYYFRILIMAAIACSIVEWLCIPVTIALKSTEKAGLAVGIVIGFGLVLPLMAAYNSVMTEFDVNILISPEAMLIEAGVAIAVYAVVYLVCLKMLKRGVS